MTLLSKICRAHSIIPTSYVLRRELICVGRVQYHGGFADISSGEYLGFPVAVKRLKMNEGDSDRTFKVPPINLAHRHCLGLIQRLCREVIGWKHLSHSNISSLLGVSMSADLRSFFILSEWMTNGNVMQYARSSPEANRLRMVNPLAIFLRFLFSFIFICGLQLSEVMSGVAYLHELGIIHGDLKGVIFDVLDGPYTSLTSETGKHPR